MRSKAMVAPVVKAIVSVVVEVDLKVVVVERSTFMHPKQALGFAGVADFEHLTSESDDAQCVHPLGARCF